MLKNFVCYNKLDYLFDASPMNFNEKRHANKKILK